MGKSGVSRETSLVTIKSSLSVIIIIIIIIII